MLCCVALKCPHLATANQRDVGFLILADPTPHCWRQSSNKSLFFGHHSDARCNAGGSDPSVTTITRLRPPTRNISGQHEQPSTAPKSCKKDDTDFSEKMTGS